MAVSLLKNERINLSKVVDKLSKVTVGLGWDMATYGNSIDCDSSVFVLRESTKISEKIGLFSGLFKKTKPKDFNVSKLINRNDIVYYGNLNHCSGCIRHRGDNLVGGSGKRNDDEQISINLKDMPDDIMKLVIVVNIYACQIRNQNFGMVKNCYARIVDDVTKEEICRYNLSDDYENSTALIVGELFKEKGEWNFEAIGKGTKDDSIDELSKRYK